jgi:hypothetical protein
MAEFNAARDWLTTAQSQLSLESVDGFLFLASSLAAAPIGAAAVPAPPAPAPALSAPNPAAPRIV